MKMYEIKAITIDSCYGRVNGYKVVARTINANKIDSLIENFRKEHQINQWWMGYEKDENGNIKIEIEEYDVIE